MAFGTRKYPRVEDGLTFRRGDETGGVFDMPNVTVDYASDGGGAGGDRGSEAFPACGRSELLGEFVPGGEPRLAPNGASLALPREPSGRAPSTTGPTVIDPGPGSWTWRTWFSAATGRSRPRP
ncbi:hypothetical protein ACRAWF_36665 [Streptomyces sp. L7]